MTGLYQGKKLIHVGDKKEEYEEALIEEKQESVITLGLKETETRRRQTSALVVTRSQNEQLKGVRKGTKWIRVRRFSKAVLIWQNAGLTHILYCK